MKHFILAAITLFVFQVNGQHNISGKIFDQSNSPLVGATVVLLDQDSTMIAFSLTNNSGTFLLEDIAKTEYIIQATYISFANYSKQLVTDWDSKDLELEPILLEESSAVLQEITIKAEHIPMGIKGDTISYNASAFKTRPNATVEDLLKKLPGIEVSRDGSIKAQGEDVQNVLVDGKEFFGSDIKMATKNLEAEAVDKVEVFDKKSEIAEFTGVDDGEDEKTINLKLKEDHKKGGFGNANLGVGTKETYNSKANYFKFTPTLQASMIFAANNVNEETFTINDRIDFMGGMMNAMSSGVLNLSDVRGLQDGINNSLSAGANLNYDFSPKLQMRSHYVLSNTKNDLMQITDVSSFTEAFEYSNSDALNSVRERLNQQINTRFNYKANPFLELIFKNNLEWTNQFSNRTSNSMYSKNGNNQGYASSAFRSESENWRFDSNTLIKKKFDKKGRNLITSITLQKENDLARDNVENINRIAENSFDLDQNQLYDNASNQLSTSINYTEPLSQKYYLGISHKYGLSGERPTRDYFDLTDNLRTLNTELSAEYKKVYQYNIAGVSLKRNSKKLKINVGLEGQLTSLSGVINDGEQKINGNYKHLLPSFRIEYDFKGGRSINGRLTSSVTAPDLEQLMPLPNNTSANYQFIGNPNLIPSYNQRLSTRYNYYDNFSFTNLYLSANITRTQNRIVTKTNIDDNLFRTIQPINVDEYWSIGSHASFSRPFKPLKLNYNIRARLQYANYESFINDRPSSVIDNNLNVRLSANNRKTEYFSVESGLTLDFYTKKYGINPDFDQNYSNTTYFIESDFYLPKGWNISADLDYIKYSAESFSDNPAYTILSGTLSKFLLKEKLEIRFTAHDIFNENIGFRRQSSANAISQQSFNNLSRYFMLGIHYKLGSGNKKNGIQVSFD